MDLILEMHRAYDAEIDLTSKVIVLSLFKNIL
jgi:hypothetical protein